MSQSPPPLPVDTFKPARWPWVSPLPGAGHPNRDWPKVTIITPSFNQGAFIEETVRSVLLQGYPNLEYIVIDGGSSDGTVDILKKYSPWISYWVSEPDGGQSEAINKGLSRASGEWVNWLNSDDLLAPGALFALVSAAGAQAAVVAGITANLRAGKIFSRYSAHVGGGRPETLFSLRVNQPGSLLRRESVQACGGVRHDLRLVMDLDLWLRIFLRHGPCAFQSTSAEVAVYRYHETSKTCSSEDAFALEEFAVLTDLAASAGIVLPDEVRDLRERSGPSSSFTLPSDANPYACERAWIERLVVNDSLLFRALRKTLPPGTDVLSAFGMMLGALSSRLSRRQQGRAWLNALEIERRFAPGPAWSALKRNPSLSTARALLRLALRR